MTNSFDSFQSLNEFDHNCQEHEDLRERTIGKGTAYVIQCTFCGCQIGQSISKKGVMSIPKLFDDSLTELFDRKYREIKFGSISRVKLGGDTFNIFDQFEKKLDAFIDEFVTASAGSNTADKSLLLNAYLTRKSDQYHKQKRSAWQSELQIKEWFFQTFSQWFYIYPEVRGYGLINGIQKRIIIDYVIIAKPELIDSGFTSKPVGIEAKFFKFQSGDGFTKSASRGVFQALSYWYSNSTWDIPNVSDKQIACVMLLSNLSFKEERDALESEPSRSKKKQWGTFLNLANNGNIGEIHYNFGYHAHPDTWAFKFGGSTYFSYLKTGKFKLGNPNMINKERIGNFK